MPVSPQDFALWSDLTGNPYPQTPAERMALAPHVYDYTRNLGRRGGPTMGPVRRAVDVLGKAALTAGAIAGAAYLGTRYGEGFTKLGLDDEPGVPAPQTAGAGGPLSQVERAAADVTPPTTSQQYGQSVVPEQTSAVQEVKGLSAIKPTQTPIEAKPVTQSAVISSQQSFSPGTEHEMVGEDAARKAEAFRKSAAYATMQKEYPSLRPIESPSTPATQPAVVLTEVEPKPEASPIAAMVTPAKAPVTASVSTGAGPTAQESREFMETLTRGAAHLTPEQKQQAHDVYFSKKYKSTSPVVEAAAPAPPIDVPSGPSAESVQFAREAARGVSRMGLLAGQEAGRAGTMTQARLGKAIAEATGFEEGGESADPRLMGQMLRRPTAVEIPSAPATTARPISFGRPAATTPGTEEHLVAQAMEHLEGSKRMVPGSFSQDIPGSSIKNITMYPGNNVSVTYKSDPATVYPFKAHPEYANELKTALNQGHFLPGGPHSAGGFIQAGINMGLLR